MLYEEIIIKAADRDLHSGHFGGTAQNPIHILSRIIASMHDANGRILVPDFYDGVHDTGPNRLAQWEALGLTEAEFLGQIGLKYASGRKDRTLIEKNAVPTDLRCQRHLGGYTGEARKPSSLRKPGRRSRSGWCMTRTRDAIQKNFRAYVAAQVPADCSVEFIGYKGSRATQVREESPELKKATDALRAEWGVEPVVLGAGGSIPIVGDFKRVLGLDALLIGFGLDDDRIHSPNENMTSRASTRVSAAGPHHRRPGKLRRRDRPLWVMAGLLSRHGRDLFSSWPPHLLVMPGLGAGIHDLPFQQPKSWMAGQAGHDEDHPGHDEDHPGYDEEMSRA